MQVFHPDSVDSTNEEAKRLIARGEITNVAYVVAREQTAGKGSRGRTWISPRDAGLYLSIVQRFKPGLDPATISLETFTLAAGVACAEVLHERYQVEVALKPINDLYVGSAKLGGILVESIVEKNLLRALVTGIGINLRLADRPLPVDAPQATCVEDVVGSARAGSISPASIATHLARSVLAWNSVLIDKGEDRVRLAWDRWRQAMASSLVPGSQSRRSPGAV